MMNPAVADDWPVFRLDNPELITFLKIARRKTRRSIRTENIIRGVNRAGFRPRWKTNTRESVNAKTSILPRPANGRRSSAR